MNTKTVLQGWQCPVCTRVYSPQQMMCMYCKPTDIDIRARPNEYKNIVSKPDPSRTFFPDNEGNIVCMVLHRDE